MASFVPSRLLWKYLPWFFLLLLLLVITSLYFAIATKLENVKTPGGREKVERPAVNVVTQVVEPTTMHDRLNLPATVYAWEDLMVKAEVSGSIVALHVEEGDMVAEGERLAEIDKRDYRNRLKAVRAQYELARINYERLRKLFRAETVPRAQLDEAKYAVDELQASMAVAELNLERCDIIAPMAGVIDAIPVSRGDIVAFGDPVAQLLKIDTLKVDVAIPEVDAPLVRTVDGCRLTIPSLGDRSVYAENIFFSSQPRRPAMVYTLRLRLDNADNQVLPGMFARADIVKRSFPDALAVPLYAVITRGDRKFVYTVEDDSARKKEVVTGILEGWQVRITSGLSPGDEVVIVGHRGIEEGQDLNVVKTVRDPARIISRGAAAASGAPSPVIAGPSEK